MTGLLVRQDELQVEGRSRKLAAMMETAVYLLSISIGGTSGQITLDDSKLGVSQAVIDKMDKSGVQARRLRVFPELGTRINYLGGLRRKIQDKYLVYVDPHWFVMEKDLPAVWAAYQEMLWGSEKVKGINTLKAEILEIYDDAKAAYLDRVAEIYLEAGIHGEDLVQIVSRHEGAFPSRTQVTNSFTVRIEGPFRIPSVKEQAQVDAELAKALADQEMAHNQTMLNRLETQNQVEELRRVETARRMLQEEGMRDVRRAFAEACASAKDEIAAIVADQLALLTKGTQGTLTPTVTTKIKDNLDRLETLVAFDGTLGELVAQVRAAAFTAADGSRYSLRRQLTELKASLATYSLTDQDGVGHKALAAWTIL